MIQINSQRLDEVVQQAFDKAQGSKRWQAAVIRAKQIIESNPYIYMDSDNTLIMLSDSNEIYEVRTAFCPCIAFSKGQPCKHRALRRLLLQMSETSH